MYYCPRCRATITAEALFCPRCGLSRAEAQQLSVPTIKTTDKPPLSHPDASPLPLPSRMATIPPTPPTVPNYANSPQVQRIPARPNSARFPDPQSQPGFAASFSVQQQPYISSAQGNAPLNPPQSSYPAPPTLGFNVAALPTNQLPPDIVKGRPPLIETNEVFPEDDDGAESYIATSVAAERWRTSWRTRQRNEAGPASLVSRGQAAVPEPLMAMQQSLGRIRAIMRPKPGSYNLRFWISLVLMLCLLAGLIAFIGVTYHTNASTASSSVQVSDSPLPELTLAEPLTATVKQGQSLVLHGENFDIGAPIIFLLDGTIAINGSNGRQLSVLTSDFGTFDVSLPIPLTWAAGPHVIQAFDNKSEQSAYLNIEITLAGTATSSSANLSLSTQLVSFHAVAGTQELAEQFVTLKNINPSSSTQWVARAEATQGLTWLNVDDTTTSGTLPISASTTLGITASTAGLRASSTPYSGKIVLTINQNEQLTLPVTLQVIQGLAEITINPNPLIGIVSTTGNSCQSNATLLLGNLSTETVSWSLNMDSSTATHIAFMIGGKPALQGRLAPAGQATDHSLLNLQCLQVKNGATYHFSIVANTGIWPVVVTIQAAS